MRTDVETIMRQVVLAYLLLLPFAVLAQDAGTRDGEVRASGDSLEAWDAVNEAWLSPDDFWQSFAERRRGKIWPSSDKFPPYAEVNEHDTFLYQHASGSCLMYFFHTRWRRANDVWRWDPRFNEYGGCANVFD